MLEHNGMLKHRLWGMYIHGIQQTWKIEIEQKELILITSVYKFMTSFLQAFDALYIGTWAVMTKREPLSHYYILSVTFSPRPYPSSRYAPFVRSTSSFHTLVSVSLCQLFFGFSHFVVGGGQQLLRQKGEWTQIRSEFTIAWFEPNQINVAKTHCPKLTVVHGTRM